MKKFPDDIRELEHKISRLKKREADHAASAKTSEYSSAAAIGMRIAVELLSAVLVGGAVGFVLDRLAGTRPLFLALFLLLGGAAGFLNVYRLAQAEEKRKEDEE